jgi:acid phosphatase (class A)
MNIYPIAIVLALLAGAAFAADAPESFLPPEALDISLVLPAPPAADSPAAKAELAEVRHIQAEASPARKEQAKADIQEDAFVFANVLGPKFTKENLPAAAAFLARLRKAEGEFVNPAKKIFNRPRPPVVDPEIVPCDKLTGSPAYPSGHATSGYLLAIVLAQAVPEKREALFLRADDYAYSRLVCGMHYPSDLEAGKISASVIAAALLANSAFEAEFAPAKAEIRTALGLPAQ